MRARVDVQPVVERLRNRCDVAAIGRPVQIRGSKHGEGKLAGTIGRERDRPRNQSPAAGDLEQFEAQYLARRVHVIGERYAHDVFTGMQQARFLAILLVVDAALGQCRIPGQLGSVIERNRSTVRRHDNHWPAHADLGAQQTLDGQSSLRRIRYRSDVVHSAVFRTRLQLETELAAARGAG